MVCEVLQQVPGTILCIEEGQEQATLRACEGFQPRSRVARIITPTCRNTAGDCRVTMTQCASSATTAQAWPAAHGHSDAPEQVKHQQLLSHYPGKQQQQQEQQLTDSLESDEDEGGVASDATDGQDSDHSSYSHIGEPCGTEVVYVREGVAVWPSRSVQIMGRLSLVAQHRVLFLAWLPYSHGTLQEDGTFHVIPCTHKSTDMCGGKDRTLYAVHPIPVSDIKALRKLGAFGLGTPSLVVVLTSGVTLPPLYFHNGGVKALIQVLKQHVHLAKSRSEPHSYLVNDVADPLQRSLTSLQLCDVLMGAPPPGASSTFNPLSSSVHGIARQSRDNNDCNTADHSSRSNHTDDHGDGGLGLDAIEPCCRGAAVDHGGGGGAGGGCDNDGSSSGGSANEGGSVLVDGPGIKGSVVLPSWHWAGQQEGPAPDPAWKALTSAFGDTLNKLMQGLGTTSSWLSALDIPDEVVDLHSEHHHHQHQRTQRSTAQPTTNCIEAAGIACSEGAACFQPQARHAATPLTHNTLLTASNSGLMAAINTDCRASHTAVPAAPVPGEAYPRPTNVASTCGSGNIAAVVSEPEVVSGSVAEEDEDDALYRLATTNAAAKTANGVVGSDTCACAVSADAASGEGWELIDGSSCGGAGCSGRDRRRVRAPPLSADEWEAMFDEEGRLVAEAAMRARVFESGMVPEIRPEAYKFLLGMYTPHSTAAERAQQTKERRQEYQVLRQQWMSISRAQAARFGKWRERKSRVDKDVRRTDRAHPFFAEQGPNQTALRNILLTYTQFNWDLGYCQGMSDLASPLLLVMKDETEAYGAFAALMERLQGNFDTDQSGMHQQLLALRKLLQVLDPQLYAFLERIDSLSLFFCFRWLLVHFKREFKMDEVLRLWEATWSCPLTRHLHLFLAVAVLVHHRRALMIPDMDFDGILKFCVELNGQLDLEPLLQLAEVLVVFAGEEGRNYTQGLP